MMQYYQEMAEINIELGNDKDAIDFNKKALQISININGSENFTTLECFLNLAQLYEKKGLHEEAD